MVLSFLAFTLSLNVFFKSRNLINTEDAWRHTASLTGLLIFAMILISTMIAFLIANRKK